MKPNPLLASLALAAFPSLPLFAGAAPQHGARAALAEDAPATSGWLPADLHLSSYVYLRVTLAGVETDAVLDSGAGGTVIDGAFADELGLASTGAVEALGAGGVQAASTVGALDLRLGALDLRLPGAVRIDLAGVHALVGRRMPLILGQDVFRALVVDVDYPHARVAFHDPARFTYTGTGTALPLFESAHGLLEVEARIEDLPAARFTLDTGSGETLHVHAPYAAANALLAGRAPTSERLGGGVGGSTRQTLARLRRFALGGRTFERLPASFPEGAQGVFASDAVAGNLGSGVLSRFRVVFDRARMRLHLEPAADLATRPWRVDRLGLSCAFREGAVVVTFVAPGSPAEAAGWRAGERVAAIQGVALAEAGWRAELDRWARGASGAELALVDGTGRTRTVVTAEYY